MEAYIKRRRERAAANKKDDLSDVTEFPRDITPVEPLSQRAFITRNLAKMSDAERKEVLDFDYIYYSPTPGTIRRRLSREEPCSITDMMMSEVIISWWRVIIFVIGTKW